jgi:hypothetical protein
LKEGSRRRTESRRELAQRRGGQEGRVSKQLRHDMDNHPQCLDGKTMTKFL